MQIINKPCDESPINEHGVIQAINKHQEINVR